MRRFAAFRFLEWGDFHISRMLFGGIVERKPEDTLGAALAMVLANDLETASLILADVKDKEWREMSPENASLYLLIFERYEETRELYPGEIERIEILQAKAERANEKPNVTQLGARSICDITGG